SGGSLNQQASPSKFVSLGDTSMRTLEAWMLLDRMRRECRRISKLQTSILAEHQEHTTDEQIEKRRCVAWSRKPRARAIWLPPAWRTLLPTSSRPAAWPSSWWRYCARSRRSRVSGKPRREEAVRTRDGSLACGGADEPARNLQLV